MKNLLVIMEGEGFWTDGKIEDQELSERVKFYEKVSWEQQGERRGMSGRRRFCLTRSLPQHGA